MHVFDAELGIGCAAVVILHYRIAYVDRVTCFYMIEEMSHIESYRRDMVIWV